MAYKDHYELNYNSKELKSLEKFKAEGTLAMRVHTIGKLYCLKGESVIKITTRAGLTKPEVSALVKKYIEETTFTKKGQHLNFQARRALEFLLKRGCSYQMIGYFIGKTGKAVGDEVKNNGIRLENYNAKLAQKRSDKRKHGSTSLKAENPDIQDFLDYAATELEEKKHSPYATAEQAKRKKGEVLFGENEIVSSSTLYRWIRLGLVPGIKIEDMIQMKPDSEPVERVFGKVSDRIDANQSIENMPPIPEDAFGEREFGHWQFDLVEGVKGGKVLLTMCETKTRFFITRQLDSKSSENVNRALREIFDEYGELAPKIFKDLLTDNGVEFLRISEVNSIHLPDLFYRVFYCHVGVPEEKGFIERLNRDARKYIKKGVDIGTFTESEIQKIQDNINSLPRRVLGFETAADMFAFELDIIRMGIDLSK